MFDPSSTSVKVCRFWRRDSSDQMSKTVRQYEWLTLHTLIFIDRCSCSRLHEYDMVSGEREEKQSDWTCECHIREGCEKADIKVTDWRVEYNWCQCDWTYRRCLPVLTAWLTPQRSSSRRRLMLVACGLMRDPDSDVIGRTVSYMSCDPCRETRHRYFWTVMWLSYMLKQWHDETDFRWKINDMRSSQLLSSLVPRRTNR